MAAASSFTDQLGQIIVDAFNVAGNLEAILPSKMILGLPDVFTGSHPSAGKTSRTVVSAVSLFSSFGSFRTLLTQHRIS